MAAQLAASQEGFSSVSKIIISQLQQSQVFETIITKFLHYRHYNKMLFFLIFLIFIICSMHYFTVVTS
jgi:hypothetical protein